MQDDLTLIFSMTDGAVDCIIKMMADFGQVTGLTLNKNRMQLLVCGTDQWGVGREVKSGELLSWIVCTYLG
jgi:hypothetical protein